MWLVLTLLATRAAACLKISPKASKITIFFASLLTLQFFQSVDAGLELEHFEKEVFTEAKKLGVRRTVHAGEAGPAESVRQVR